jgi:hypothetical protein
MSAWRKQAIPLVFLEIGMGAVIGSNAHNKRINVIKVRIDKWLHEAWQPLKDRGHTQAVGVTQKAATAIQASLGRLWADNGGLKTPSELPSAMLAMAEDVRQQLPKNDKARIRAWGYLVAALYDLCLVADPELSDNPGQVRGLEIAKIVMREAA